MTRIADAFARLAAEHRAALILYVTAGHPDLETSYRAAMAAAEYADIVEIGIPFSDPVADGPVIQASTQAALRKGVTPADCFELARRVRAATECPLVFLTYYNPVVRVGLDTFARECREAGVDGVICADLPAEESSDLQRALAEHGLDLIPMVAPTSTDERLAAALHGASGFVYCVSRTGVTGVRESLSEGLASFLDRVRRFTDLPRAVGFGVSTADHARSVSAVAEGVIIGSALVRLIEEAPADELEARIGSFSHAVREGINGGE